MRPIWIIASNDIRMFLKDKAGYVWLFVMPLVFTFFFGIALKGETRNPSNPRPKVRVENLDEGYLGYLLMEEMGASGLNLIPSDSDEDVQHGIRIPKDYTAKIEAQKPAKLELQMESESGDQAAALIEVRLFRSLLGLTSDIFQVVTTSGEMTEARLKAAMAREGIVGLDVRYAGKEPPPGGYAQSVPGYMVMFVMMNLLMYGGISIAEERRAGVMRRLAIQPLSRLQLVAGKITGRFLLGAVQVTFFLLSGKLLFKMDYGQHLELIILMMGVYALGCASLGVLIGAVITTPERVQGMCMLLSITAAAMGGCWWPIELVPDTARTLGHLFPTAWAMDGLHQLISFDGGFAQIRREFFVLAAFALGSTFLAGKYCRY